MLSLYLVSSRIRQLARDFKQPPYPHLLRFCIIFALVQPESLSLQSILSGLHMEPK